MKALARYSTLVLLATATVGAGAQPTAETDLSGEPDNAKTFTEMDGNRDGVLTRSEVERADFPGAFEDLDKDGDAQVNRNEYYQYYRDRITRERD